MKTAAATALLYYIKGSTRPRRQAAAGQNAGNRLKIMCSHRQHRQRAGILMARRRLYNLDTHRS